MTKPIQASSTAAVLVAFGLFAASIAVRAETAPANPQAPSAAQARHQCEGVRLARWFDGQRQLTDGSADPFANAAPRDACVQ